MENKTQSGKESGGLNTMTKSCIICSFQADFFFQMNPQAPVYYKCSQCSCIFEDERFYLDLKEEKSRYDMHENDVDDVRYQNFVAPVVSQVKKNYKPSSLGLDFGAGTGPVITKLLQDENYHLECYDPFYHNTIKLNNENYDYIVCCEVMEHFHQPLKEFKWMRSLLKPSGHFFGKTKMISDDFTVDEFRQFGYKNDPTHVCFYAPKTLETIKQIVGFSDVYLADDIIVFTK